jgi:Transposase
MKYARVTRPEAAPGALSAGIDWSSADHAVCIVDMAGAVVSRFTVAHTAEGLRALIRAWPAPECVRLRSSVVMGRSWTPCWRRG